MQSVATRSSDAELVQAARAGSEAAFAQIVVRYEGPLRAHCRRILDPSSAEDAVQQAFMQAFVALGNAPGGDVLLRPWLYRIAHNCAVDMLRSGGAASELAAELDETRPGGAGSQPAQSLEERERLRDVMRLLSALPRDQRRAIVARELEGRSYEEISDELGATQGGVRQLIFRARSTLRSAAAAMSPWPLREWLQAMRPDSVRDALLVVDHARSVRVAPALAALAAAAGAGGSGAPAPHAPAWRPPAAVAGPEAGPAPDARRGQGDSRRVRVRPGPGGGDGTRVATTAPSTVSRSVAAPRDTARAQDPRGVPERVDRLGGRDARPEGAPRVRSGPGAPAAPAAPAGAPAAAPVAVAVVPAPVPAASVPAAPVPAAPVTEPAAAPGPPDAAAAPEPVAAPAPDPVASPPAAADPPQDGGATSSPARPSPR